MRTNAPIVRLSVLICFFVTFSSPARLQSIQSANGKYEMGLGFGPMFFVGDLGGSQGVGKSFVKDLDLPLTKLSKGFYFNYYPLDFVGFRLAGNLGYLEGDDLEAPSKGGAEMDRRERGLNFKTSISEVYGAIELYPTFFLEKYEELKGKLKPYVLLGGGIYHFNPMVKDIDGSWVKTKPLSLEGQGFKEYPDSKPYKLTQLNYMFGFGVKFYLNNNFYTGFEVLHRKLSTDYVDDVSHNYYVDPIYFDRYLSPSDALTARRLFYRGNYSFPSTRPYEEFAERGDPTRNDAYFSSVVRVGWRFFKTDKRLKCPMYY